MKKHKIAKIMTICTAAFILFTGCGKNPSAKDAPETQEPKQSETQTQEPEQATSADPGEIAAMKLPPTSRQTDTKETVDYGTPEEGVIRAMVLSDAHGNLYYVDVNTGTFFTAPIPGDLTDSDGNPLDPDQVTAGYVIDIYGNGMMLESYPGQYPGVSKMVLVKEGSAEDTAPYQHLVDEISITADPSEPPSMNANYRTDLANVTLALTRGNYEWNYTDENGEAQNVIACGSHILSWPELNDIRMNAPTDKLELTLFSSYKPESVSVTRFPLDQWDKGASSEKKEEVSGEPVDVQDTSEGYAMTAEAGYVYLVEAQWAEGNVEFGFYTLYSLS